jgi:hypothetical protein
MRKSKFDACLRAVLPETGVSHMKSKVPKSGVQGEGDYVSARKYNQRTRQFVESGKVEEAAGRATPRNAEEEAEMRRAEEEGRSHAKGNRRREGGSEH